MNTTNAALNTTTTTPATHFAILNGDRRECTPETFMDVCDELVRKHGGGVPRIELIDGNAIPAPAPAMAPAPAAAPAVTVVATPAPRDERVAHLVNTARSVADLESAMAQGFAPARTLYERGTAVNSTGVDNARRSRLEHNAKPTVAQYCEDFIGAIKAEARTDTAPFATSSIRMDAEGMLAVPNQDARMVVEPRALQGLIARIGCGGAAYLAEHCPPKLRAINVNNQAKFLEELEASMHAEAFARAVRDGKPVPAADPSMTVLRTRLNQGTRVGFAAVSDSYTAFDVDRIAEALRLAAPADARGTVTYDGTRARFEVVFHSDVQAEDYVCGEFFKAAVIIRANDTGNGGISGSAALFQNLCLNLIVIDEASKPVFNLRHVGSVEALASKFRAGFDSAIAQIKPFLNRWGYAVHEDVRVRSQATTSDEIPLSIEEALPGFFNALIERELVPVRTGNSKEVRKQALADFGAMYARDESVATRDGIITRAGIVNAVTRYAHEVNQDPWLEDELQAAAGALLIGRKGGNPDPLPYIPFE